ncbi:transposase [Mesobacillus maritimus]|uniref:transposase n=1 Tax=Mesobacillus maritimus TaxID=1643336 RepID=UPI00384D29FD
MMDEQSITDVAIEEALAMRRIGSEVAVMPREARQKSTSGVYHVMLRGANRQEIFHDDEDRMKFLNCLKKYKGIAKFNLYAWCLMDNHVHLLLKEGEEELATTMKRIGVSYVSFYNWKYCTTGHLFQDRFKSECVETGKRDRGTGTMSR